MNLNLDQQHLVFPRHVPPQNAPLPATAAPRAVSSPDWLKILTEQAAALRFGSIQITVSESQVVEIEKTEKTRHLKAAPRNNNRS